MEMMVKESSREPGKCDIPRKGRSDRLYEYLYYIYLYGSVVRESCEIWEDRVVDRAGATAGVNRSERGIYRGWAVRATRQSSE